MTVISSHFGYQTPIKTLHLEKIAKVVLLYVFNMAFPASLFLTFLLVARLG